MLKIHSECLKKTIILILLSHEVSFLSKKLISLTYTVTQNLQHTHFYEGLQL